MDKFNLKKYLAENKLLKEASVSGLEIYEIATPQPKSILKEELEDLFGSDYRNIITEFSSSEGYESVLMINITDGDIEKIKENIGDVLIWKIEIGNKESIAEGKLVKENKEKDYYNLLMDLGGTELAGGKIEDMMHKRDQFVSFEEFLNDEIEFFKQEGDDEIVDKIKSTFLTEGELVKESLQQLTPEEKSLLKDILEEKAEFYEFGIDRYEVFIKDPNSKISRDEIEELKNNSEIVRSILNRL